MGKEWKHHKYLRKEGKRYFYKEPDTSVEGLTGIENPDMQGLADSLGKLAPVKKLREAMNMKIYSPNKEDETLVSKAQKRLDDLVNKKKDKDLLAGGK